METCINVFEGLSKCKRYFKPFITLWAHLTWILLVR